MIKTRANRTVCNIKLFNFLEVIDDCETILDVMSKLNEFEKYKMVNMKMYTKIRIREAIGQAWIGELDKSSDRFETIRKLMEAGDPYLDPIC